MTRSFVTSHNYHWGRMGLL